VKLRKRSRHEGEEEEEEEEGEEEWEEHINRIEPEGFSGSGISRQISRRKKKSKIDSVYGLVV
jgi:hypothetical protein